MEEKRNVDDKQMLNNSHKQFMGRSESRAKTRPRSKRSPRSTYVCHHCGLQGHTRPNCQKLRAMNNASAPRSRGPWSTCTRSRSDDPGVIDVMKMIRAFTSCLESFTRRFESPNSCTQSYKDITPNASDVWVSMHQYFLCFVTLFSCLFIDYVIWNLFVCFCILSYKLSSILLLINLFILMCQKSKNHIKSRKSKVWLTLLSFVLKLVLPCTFVLMALCIYERSLFLCTLITVEEILKSMWLL